MAKPRKSCATKFLYFVAICTILVIAGAFAYRFLEKQLMRWALVPGTEFHDVPMPQGANYGQAALWIARPDIANNPALWLPPGVQRTNAAPRASIFFVHPTSFTERGAWNAPLNDRESQNLAALFVRSQASAFNSIGQIWAPRYRQATFGAFLANSDNARHALDFAYRDVVAAYEEFLREAPADRPIILAAHSQGSMHLMRLLEERIRNAPEASRVAAVYLVGWPVSLSADLPALPFPACQTPDQARCVLSWMSYAEPADSSQILDVWDETSGARGARRGTDMLCTNPLTGTRGGAAGVDRNLGTLIPNEQMTEAEMRPHAVAARCGPRGILLIGETEALPAMGPYALPGNNYHVYDYALFWANVRADAERRLAAFERTPR
jgi:pimeloyl-ACP methyl ester carboxylesterase